MDYDHAEVVRLRVAALLPARDGTIGCGGLPRNLIVLPKGNPFDLLCIAALHSSLKVASLREL